MTGHQFQESEGSIMGRFTGDDTAFEALYHANRSAVYSTAYACLHSLTDIDDIVQETFLAAYLQYDSIRCKDNIGAWLCGTARNLALKKRRSTRFTLPLEEIETVLSGNVERDCIRREENAEIRRAIAALSGPIAETVSLFYLAGKTISEIAGLLGVPEGTVKSRLHDGRKALRGELLRRLQMEGENMEKKNLTKEVEELLTLAGEGRTGDQTAALANCNKAIGQLADTAENYGVLAKLYQYRAYAESMTDRQASLDDMEKSAAYAKLSGDGRLMAECMLSLAFDKGNTEAFREAYRIAAEAGHTAVMAEAACWEGIHQIREGQIPAAKERLHDAIRCHSQLTAADTADCCRGDSVRVRAMASAALDSMDLLPEDVLTTRRYAALNLFCQLIRYGENGVSGEENYGWDIPGTEPYPNGSHRFFGPLENMGPVWTPELEASGTHLQERYNWNGVLSAMEYTAAEKHGTITTAAGTFTDCLHIRIRETIPGYDPENAAHREADEYRSETEYWLAPDVGLVRIDIRYPNTPRSGSRMELTGYTVKPDPERRYFPLTEDSRWEYAVYDHEGRPLSEVYDYRSICRMDTVANGTACMAWSGYVRDKR